MNNALAPNGFPDADGLGAAQTAKSPEPVSTGGHSPRPSEDPSQRMARIKLLLFVNLRNQASALVEDIRATLAVLGGHDLFELEITQVREHPQLVEHFKLVATPSLVKTHPLPSQVLTGSNVTDQLRYWWPRWKSQLERVRSASTAAEAQALGLSGPSTELSEHIFRLSDEAFSLRQANASLEAQLRFRDRILAILAHDLRNPLLAASLAIETLEKGLTGEVVLSPDLSCQLAAQARTQLKLLGGLVADLLRPDWGQERLAIQPLRLDLSQMQAGLLEQFEEQLVAKGQLLRIDIPLDLPPACADPERIRQVFGNLLDNAIKYTAQGGEITISAFHRTSQKLEVSVCDTGPGIPLEDQQRIFEHTVRLERDQATAGYGIGLALCDRIIKAHYCRIWVDSRVPEGSCFRFTLPVYEE